jgi:hypothetical protein
MFPDYCVFLTNDRITNEYHLELYLKSQKECSDTQVLLKTCQYVRCNIELSEDRQYAVIMLEVRNMFKTLAIGS